MRPSLLVAVSVLLFVAALAVTVPMRLALAWASADRAGVSAAEVSGSMWDGRLRAAQYRGVPLGDVEASLDPFALFAGTRRLAVRGTLGRATLVDGGSRGFEMADAAIEVEHLRPAVPLTGRLRLESATLLFSANRCERAAGRIATDILQRAFNGPEVAGNLSCAGDAATAQLQGRVQDTEVSIILRLDGTGRYQAETRIVSTNPAVRGALALAGFVDNGDGLTRSDEGALGT
jgi:general secretion pathway protein N